MITLTMFLSVAHWLWEVSLYCKPCLLRRSEDQVQKHADSSITLQTIKAPWGFWRMCRLTVCTRPFFSVKWFTY